jgi:hypothetical protein
MNIYDRIINILLEARIEDYVERLDESTRYQREIDAGNLSKRSISRIRYAVKTGKREAPQETRLGPEFGEPTGRITAIARLEKRVKNAERNKAKGKPYEYNLPEVDKTPRELPRGPGKQTGPLEKRGMDIAKRNRNRNRKRKANRNRGKS